MIDVDSLGKAIHDAKRVGGPWGAACGYVEARIAPDGRSGENVFVTVDYNQGPAGEYACECESQARHLIELMAEQ